MIDPQSTNQRSEMRQPTIGVTVLLGWGGSGRGGAAASSLGKSPAGVPSLAPLFPVLLTGGAVAFAI